MRTIYLAKVMVVAVLLLAPGLAQDRENQIDKSQIPAEADSVEKFVPHGWRIEERLIGDLNGDSIPDYALTMVEDRPAKDSDGFPTERQRALVILLQTAGGKLSRAAVADRLLICTRCGGTFYAFVETPANVQIQKGVIVVEQTHGSREVTEMSFKFRYDAASGQFILIGFDYVETDRLTAIVVSESTNYLTGVRIVTRSERGRDTKSRTAVAVKKTSIEQVVSGKFELAAAKRLGLY
jgi:hypothetical protein